MTLAKGTVRRCLYFNECLQKEIHDGIKWQIKWHQYKDGWICKKHFVRLIINPKHNPKQTKEYRKKYSTPKYTKKYTERWIKFLGKNIYIGRKIRLDFCTICKRKKGIEIITTRGKRSRLLLHLHHWFYLPIMVWACADTICNQCHPIETAKKKISL